MLMVTATRRSKVGITGPRLKGMYPITTAEGEEIKLPSVTTILNVLGKPALIHWAANRERVMCVDTAADLFDSTSFDPMMSKAAFVAALQERLGETRAHERELAKAGDIGTLLHKRVEWVLHKELGQTVGPQPDIPKEAENAFESWLNWRREVKFRPILIEQKVYSLRYRYAGMMDVYAEVCDEIAVVDWKTGKAIYAEAYLQSAAYRGALMEMQPDRPPPTKGYIVRLPKTAGDTFEVAQIDEAQLDKCFSLFRMAIEMWKYQTLGVNGYTGAGVSPTIGPVISAEGSNGNGLQF